MHTQHVLRTYSRTLSVGKHNNNTSCILSRREVCLLILCSPPGYHSSYLRTIVPQHALAFQSTLQGACLAVTPLRGFCPLQIFPQHHLYYYYYYYYSVRHICPTAIFSPPPRCCVGGFCTTPFLGQGACPPPPHPPTPEVFLAVSCPRCCLFCPSWPWPVPRLRPSPPLVDVPYLWLLPALRIPLVHEQPFHPPPRSCRTITPPLSWQTRLPSLFSSSLLV